MICHKVFHNIQIIVTIMVINQKQKTGILKLIILNPPKGGEDTCWWPQSKN